MTPRRTMINWCNVTSIPFHTRVFQELRTHGDNPNTSDGAVPHRSWLCEIDCHPVWHQLPFFRHVCCLFFLFLLFVSICVLSAWLTSPRSDIPALLRIRRIRKQASSAAAMRQQHKNSPISDSVERESGTATHFYSMREPQQESNGTTDVIPRGFAHVCFLF